jgi:hypothetical protein
VCGRIEKHRPAGLAGADARLCELQRRCHADHRIDPAGDLIVHTHE